GSRAPRWRQGSRPRARTRAGCARAGRPSRPAPARRRPPTRGPASTGRTRAARRRRCLPVRWSAPSAPAAGCPSMPAGRVPVLPAAARWRRRGCRSCPPPARPAPGSAAAPGQAPTPAAAGMAATAIRRAGAGSSRVGLAEVHRRRVLDRLDVVHGEVRPGVVAEQLGGEVDRETTDVGVVVLHRLDVTLALDGDPVLRALQLRLQLQEVLVGPELRVVVARPQRSPAGAVQLALRLLEPSPRLG